MSNKKTQAKSPLVLQGFKGVDRRVCQSDPPCASRLVNFFIRSDGSLEKRCGYRPLVELGESVRALWTGTVQGTPTAYLLQGNTLYSLDLSTLERQAMGTVETSEGDACIFFYRGELYLLDATGFYRWRNSTLARPLGYVPLIGKDWANNEIGPTFEPKNILNPHARISYLITDPPSIFLCAEDEILSVQAVYVNGVLQPLDAYTLDTDFNTVNVPGLAVGDRVVVYLTFRVDYSAVLSELYSSPNVILFGDANNDRLFFWGGNQGSKVFCSAFVSEEQLKESRRHFPESNELYFPDGFAFCVGTGQEKLRGAVRHRDQLLLFTERETWVASSLASGLEDFPAVCLDPQLGCDSPEGVALAGNDPICFHRGSLWKWTDSSLLSRNAHCISREIESLIPKDARSSACLLYDRHRDALWVYLPTEQAAWVLSLTHGTWSYMTGICGDRLLELDGSVGFLHGTTLYVFDPDCRTDRESGTESREIVGIYESNLLDFGSPSMKNLALARLTGDLDGGVVTMVFSGNGIPAVSRTFSDPKGESHSILQRRATSGRFLYATVSLSAPGNARQVLHGLSLHLRESS